MNFTDFTGNEKVKERLSKMLESGRLPHAVIIEGEEGLGKKTLARELARALVCRGESRPCGECTQCHKASAGVHPDISEYIPSGTANSFHVDTVREIITDAYMQPNEAEYKVYILADAHCMNANAQNALLKILEEPPEYVIFILTVKSKSALLSTVLSRSTVVTLEGVQPQEAARYIASHAENVDYDRALKAASNFNGNIGRAMASIQDEKASEMLELCSSLCRALANSNEYELLTLCAAFQKDRQGVVFACEFLKNIFRDALYGSETSGYISGDRESAELLKSKISRQSLVKLIGVCDDIKEYALMNANNALLISKFCYSLKRAIGR